MQPRPIPTVSSSLANSEDNSMVLDNEMATPPTTTSHINSTPFAQSSGLAFSKIDESQPSTPPVPVRFASNTNAFGLSSSNSNLSSSSSISSINTLKENINNGPVFGISGMKVDISPPSAGSITTRKLRRPSMLSLQQNISFSSDNSGKADDESTPIGELFSSEKLNKNINGLNLIQDPSSSKTNNQIKINQKPKLLNGTLIGNPFNSNTLQPTPRWAGNGGSFANAMIRRTSSAPLIPFEDLKTSTPPIPSLSRMISSDNTIPFDIEENNKLLDNKSSINWAYTTSIGNSSGKGKSKMKEDEEELQLNSPPLDSESGLSNVLPTFTGKPLPNALLQTLASEQKPMDHEMKSEAKLQRYLLSHPSKLPLTPRAPKGSRGRFPDQVGGDDDDADDDEILFPTGRRISSNNWTTTRRSRNWMDRARFDQDSDTESEEEEEDENMNSNNINKIGIGNGNGIGNGKEEPVINAFAAGMDMDRPVSSSSSSMNLGSWGIFNNSNSEEGSGKSTPPHPPTNIQTNNGPNPNPNPFPTPPSSNSFPPNFNSRSARLSFSSVGQGMVPSPGYGLPSAFGGLGMGGNGNGIGTPLGSPTIERSELGASPNANANANAIGIGSPGLMHYRESQGGQATVRPGKRKAQAEDRFDPYKRPRGTSPSLLGSSPFPISPSRTSAILIPQSPSHIPLYPSALSSLSTSHPNTGRHTRPTHPYTRPMTGRSRAASPALSIGSASGLGSSLGNNGSRGFNLSGNSNNGNSNGNGNGQQQQLGGLGLLSLQNRLKEEDEKGLVEAGEEMLREDSEERMEED